MPATARDRNPFTGQLRELPSVPVTAQSTAARQAVVDAALADPPVVHYLTYQDLQAGTLTGVHRTEESCYRFLATICHPGSRTLETGAGISTVLFAAWGTQHRCVTPLQEEADAILDYCCRRGISTDGVIFDINPSVVVLPLAGQDEDLLDVVFIDGNHGFPHPMLDWYFAAGRLREGGVVVLDDIQLPSVRVLRHFLDLDVRWLLLERTSKWAAYRRASDWSFLEDWYSQPFYRTDGLGLRAIELIETRVRGSLGPLKRFLRR